MPGPPPDLATALYAIGEALLIGLLVGFQREAATHDERHPGVRDFVMIAVSGGVCGVLQNAWLTVAALISISILLAVFHFQTVTRTGITTEMTAVAIFTLGFLTASPLSWAAPAAISTTIVLVALLEAKRALHKLIHETVTETEFDDTIWFLAIIFIIYPLLPQGEFGPFHFFPPRKVWLFVILISSINYLGYFFQKFLGATKGLALTAVLGGLASTTASTAAFARSTTENREALHSYWMAAVIANTVHFPRVLGVLLLMSPDIARASLAPMLPMMAAGAIFAAILAWRGEDDHLNHRVQTGNPFRLAPALKLAAIFTVVLFLTRAAAARLGADAVYGTSALGGSVDVDAVVLSVSDLFSNHKLAVEAAQLAVLIAMVSNAVLKIALAFWWGSSRFGLRVAAGFLVIFAGGGVIWKLLPSW